MKKKAHYILGTLRSYILSEEFKNTHRTNEKSFIRNCVLTFGLTLLFILNLMHKSLQAELNHVLGGVVSLPKVSKQAFSLARKKLHPSAFVALNHTLIQEFYCDNEFKKLPGGYRPIVVDGSTLQLPEGNDIKDKYGASKNQHGEMNMARISCAYDPLNGMVFHAIIAPYTTCERSMAFEHILGIPPSNCAEDLYFFDRGYPSVNLVFFLLYHKKNFIMRCSTAWIAPVKQLGFWCRNAFLTQSLIFQP